MEVKQTSRTFVVTLSEDDLEKLEREFWRMFSGDFDPETDAPVMLQLVSAICGNPDD